MDKLFIPWRVFYLLVTVLVSSQAQTPSPGPNAFENVCEDTGLSDNLACGTEDDFMVCFPRTELCSGTAFCRDGADEESATQIGLDCDGRLTGRKEDDTGKVQPGFLCSDGLIIDIDQMCDGTASCRNGEDETYILCANKCMAPYYGGCAYTRQCTSTVETATCGNCRPGFARNPSNFTIGECVDATFRFCRATYHSGCEGNYDTLHICLDTDGVLDQAVVIEVSTVDGSATAGLDYVPLPSSTEVVFSPFTEGGTSRSLRVRTLTDSITGEGRETFDVVASVDDWLFKSGGERATVTITECSAPGSATLVTVSASSVTEGPDVAIMATIRLASGIGTLENDVVVDVTTSGRTGIHGATGGDDYIETSSTVTFESGTIGRATRMLSIPIVDDNIAEYIESFTIRVQVRGTDGIGRFRRLSHSQRVSIRDNDPFEVAFEHSEYNIMEGDEFEVCLIGVTTPMRVHPFTVSIHTTHDCDSTTEDATADVDYEALYGRVQVLFPPESYRECVTIQTYHDVFNEQPEVFILWAQRISGLGQLSENASVIIQSVNTDPVTVSIEESSYTVTQPENSVEVCVSAEGRLDQLVTVTLETLSQSETLTLSSSVLRSCSFLTFDINAFGSSGQAVILQATVVSSNRRITTGRSIAEIILLRSDNPDECPQLADPQNGQVEQSLSDGLISPGSVATYSCNIGFVPEGTRFRVCIDDFTWSGELPTCEQETVGELMSSNNDIILGLSMASPFVIVTTADLGFVHYVATGESFSRSQSINNRNYRSFGVSSQASAKGIHVKAEFGKEITVYGWERFSSRFDAFLAFSTANSVSTYEYYSIPYNHVSSVMIVAQEDNTDVTVSFFDIQLDIDRFQTYKSPNIMPRSTIRLESNKPLSITSAKTCSQRDCDYLVEQILPTHLWGRTFLVASFSGPKTGESVRVIASQSSTSVTITCANFERTLSGIEAGSWRDFEIDRRGRDAFCVVEATAPVYVLQYAKESVGGSYMMTIPAIEQYGSFFTGFFTPNRSPFNYINVYVTPEHFIPGGILVDGAPVQDWTRVRCFDDAICGYIARPTLRRNTNYHTVHHVDPRARLGFSAYGFDLTRRTSYGYPGSLEIPSPQRIDECLPEIDPDVCDANSACMNPNGYFECVCIPGFQIEEGVCTDIDECEERRSRCDINAMCVNTVGSHTCTCRPGFIGSGRTCTPESDLVEFEDYIPFIDFGQERIEVDLKKDDDCQSVTFEEAIPIAAMKINQLHICDNGIISIGDKPFKYWNPVHFPSGNPLISRSSILAVFWNDHEPLLSTKVAYQIFENNNEVKSTSRFVSEQEGSIKFEGKWMIVVEWENVSPYVRGQSEVTNEMQNSYQAVIISDFIRTYAVFTYNTRRLRWAETRDGAFSVVGYNFGGSSASSLPRSIPTFQNYRFSGTPSVANVSLGNLQFGVPWANLIYLIGLDRSTGQQAVADCRTMQRRDIEQFNRRGIRVEQGLACPCSAAQAFRDRRYIHASGHLAGITGDEGFNSRNCFVQVFRPLRANRGVHMCCYSVEEGIFGALLDSSFADQGSSSLRFHPYTEPDDYVEYDYLFLESCCFNGGDTCQTYTEQREADDCSSYQPSRFAWCWGDPHITTLDGAVYTFNGWGEYILLDINTDDSYFLFHGRTHPVDNSDATQLVAFAFGASKNNPVQIQLSESNSIVVLLNGSDITANIPSSSSETYFSSNFDIFITRDSSTSLTCGFPNGISVTATVSSGMLAFVLEIPEEFQNISRGLMGNNNGIATDDVVYRNGTMLAHNVSDRLIHEVAQSWQILPEESLFTYPEGLSAEDFAHPDHAPKFLEEVVATATDEVLTACGDSVQCIFDASQTGDLNIGLETMTINLDNIMNQQEAVNRPPVIRGPPILVVTLGQQAELVFTVMDENTFVAVSVAEGPPVNSTLTSNPFDEFTTEYTFSWTIFEIVDVSLMFVARDERDAVSVLNVQVQICACINGAECTLDGLLSTTGNTIVLNCNCPEAYGGRFCAEDFDGCSEIICFEDVPCVDVAAPAVGAMCGLCPSGYFGDGQKCDDINECEQDLHFCSDICVNTQGGFECACNPGFSLVNASTCGDIDECAVLNGECHQICSNADGGFSCGCNDGFQLTNDNRTCEVLPQSACDSSNVCTQNCVRIFGVEQCSCDLGFELQDDGISCLDTNECEVAPCDQTCTNLPGGFECSCGEGYVLDADQRTCLDIDECSVAAENNTELCTSPMFCSNTMGAFDCLCPGGTEEAGGTCIPIGDNTRRVNDSVIGDPLMTVPLNLPNTSVLAVDLEENEAVNLCYEIHGRAGEYFNLVSDSCVSVNAHYSQASPQLGLNIIDEVTVRAATLDGICRNIAVVRGSNCQVSIDGSVINETYSSAGVSVRIYRNRVRISVPNCQNLDLVMWVFCEQEQLRGVPESEGQDITVTVDMIRFVIARGFNIRETAHGLLGQFWNIPVGIERYTGSLFDGSVRSDTYILTVNYPGSPPRRFLTFLHSPTWDRRGKEYCLYGGNRQGGGIFEIESPNDPLIEGVYRDYIVSGPFEVEFMYSHFQSSECG